MYNFNQQQQMNINNDNIQIQSAYSYNPAMNSPVPPQVHGRMSMGNQFNNQGCPSPMMGNFNAYNQQQMYFNDAMMTAPGSFSSYFNLNDASCNDNIDFDNMMSFDPTPRKRSFNYVQNPRMDQMQNSNKRMHIEAPRMKTTPTNENYRRSLNIGFVRVTSMKKVFSCFIGGCRFKTFSCQQFVQHLSFFHNDQRDVLKGFCMLCENFDCGCSIYNDLHGHPSYNPQPAQLQIKEVISQADHIKKEVECDINDQTDFIDNENATILSNIDESEARTTSEIEDESRSTPSLLELTQIIPMEPPVDFNSDKIPQIKQESLSIPITENLEATVILPEPDSPLLVPINPVFKLPESGSKVPTKKPTRTLRKRAMSTYVESERKSPESNKKQKSQTVEDIGNSDPLSETMCLDFISKKIIDAKNKDNHDKFKNFKPNESIFKLVDVTSMNDAENNEEISKNSNKARREALDEKLKNKFNDFSEKRKEFSSRRESLRPRKSDEEKEPKIDDISFSNITIDNLLERIKNSAKSKKSSSEIEDVAQKSKQKSTIAEYFQKPDKRDEENLNDDLMLPNQEEKTPQKSKKKSSKDKENDEKVEKTRRSLRSRRSGSENEQKLPEIPESSKSTSFNEKSSTSINSSSTSALELSKHIPYTVDIEALIANASSSFEFGSIKDLYPWIDENITSAIFKTKTSIDILLNEFSLFSTYKCMNELCYFFTTDIEEFKKHARSHDSFNNYCSYCLMNFEKSNDLCSHLEVAHKFDRFQCSKCMFRSCQKGYVDVHQRIHHSDIENCEVFKSPVQKLLKCDRSKCLPALQKNREKFVMPYRCKTPKCKEIFYCKDNFRKHLDMESNKPNCQEFVTLICQQLYSIDHSRTTNKTEGIYQCLHCQYGTDESDIFDHMALNHPHEFAYICKRVKPQKLIELNIVSARETVENSTSIDYIGTTTAEAKAFGGNLEQLNSTNLEKEAKNVSGKKKLVVSEVVSLDD